MRRRTLVSLVSAVLVAAGLTAISAPPASAADNVCAGVEIGQILLMPTGESTPLYMDDNTDVPFIISDGASVTKQFTFINQAAMGDVNDRYAFDVNLTCGTGYYLFITISDSSDNTFKNANAGSPERYTLTKGYKFSVSVTGISKPLVIAANVALPGQLTQSATSSNIWGTTIDGYYKYESGNEEVAPAWTMAIAQDSWASGDDWLHAACGAALKATSDAVAPVKTVWEYDDVNVTINDFFGNAEMDVAGLVGRAGQISYEIPDFVLTNSACGWNLSLSGKTDAEVAAQLEGKYDGAVVPLTVTSNASDKTHTVKMSIASMKSGKLPATLKPKSADSGGGSTPAAKKTQSASFPPKVPASVKWSKKIVVLKSQVTTDAGQTATAKVACAKKMKCKSKTLPSGAVTVTTKKKTGKITLTLSAPATATFDAYSYTKVIKLKK